jgi:hypothetical protein
MLFWTSSTLETSGVSSTKTHFHLVLLASLSGTGMITIESAFYVFMKADTCKRLSIEANKRKWYGRVIISSDSDPYYFGIRQNDLSDTKEVLVVEGAR